MGDAGDQHHRAQAPQHRGGEGQGEAGEAHAVGGRLGDRGQDDRAVDRVVRHREPVGLRRDAVLVLEVAVVDREVAVVQVVQVVESFLHPVRPAARNEMRISIKDQPNTQLNKMK